MNLRGLYDKEIIDPEILTSRMRHKRGILLAESDWAMASDAPTNKEAWVAYRQALRDFPATWVPSEEANFPNKPEV